MPNTQADADSDRPGALLIAVALGLCALRLFVAGATGLVDDEAYYRLWSLAPSLSYLDHPPMVAWLIGAGRAVAGDTPLGVRLLGPTLLLLGTALIWRTALLLYGGKIARRAAWFVLAMPLLGIGGIIITPDLPSVAFSGLVVLGLIELERSGDANWWLAIGLFAGLGLLSKYTNLFLGATILIWILAVPGNTKWFRAPQLWIGGLVAAIVGSPVAIWNAEHDWASFAKQFGRVAHNARGGGSYISEFLGNFLALASPVIGVLAIVGLVGVTRAALAKRKSSDVLLAATIWPMLAYFLVHALHDRVDGNWPAPLYLPLAIAAALGLDAIRSERWREATYRTALTVGFVMIAFIYAHALHPLVTVGRDPTEQLRGWPAFGDAIDQKRREAGAEWIATSSYATTGQLAFAVKGRSEVAQLDQRLRYIFLPALAPGLVAKPALYVELQRRIDPELLKDKFGKVVPLGSLTRVNGTKDGATYQLFLVTDPPVPPLHD